MRSTRHRGDLIGCLINVAMRMHARILFIIAIATIIHIKTRMHFFICTIISLSIIVDYIFHGIQYGFGQTCTVHYRLQHTHIIYCQH